MTYVQANILLCATYMTPSRKEDLFEQAISFEDSLEACYKKDRPMSDWTPHPDYFRELQVLLSQNYKELLGCKGASAVAIPRSSNFVGASSLLLLHQSVAIAAAMVTSPVTAIPRLDGRRDRH